MLLIPPVKIVVRKYLDCFEIDLLSLRLYSDSFKLRKSLYSY
jgi:hypothetical protein